MTPLPNRPAAWRLAPLVDLHWRRWEQEWLVYDLGSNQTLKLDTLTAMTLMVLESGARAAPDIEAVISSELALDPSDASALSDRLGEALSDLRQRGLVESPSR